jgi:hypothetical protein
LKEVCFQQKEYDQQGHRNPTRLVGKPRDYGAEYFDMLHWNL